MKVAAYINHSRWVVECPRKTCKSASQVDGEAFRCPCRDQVVCAHKVPCGQPIEPQYPADREAIVAVLAKRALPANRNWHPGETAATLAAENIEHKVGI